MHPSVHAKTNPDKPAYIMGGSGETVTYGELDARSNQGAHLFRSLGIGKGGSVAIFMDNSPRYYEVLWAAQRSGIRFTAISSKLTAGEVEYIVKDCEAQALIASKGVADVAVQIAPLIPGVRLFMVDGAAAPFASFEDARARFPTTPIADEGQGGAMLYSSGTTGKPKGVKRAITGETPIDAPNPLSMMGTMLYGWNPDSIYLSPAPLYHAAPLGWSMGVQSLGGTVIVMERFDPEDALRLIEKYKITTAQWVPTHFVRMLKLPPEVRSRYDVSSLTQVFHAAAPCPVPIKQQMIEWWGPIISEYYAGTEGNGFTTINSEQWLGHKGSVGKALNAELKICDEDGEPLPPRSEGVVYFAGGGQFEYHNDPKKTAESRNKHGWTTLGDVGWVDEEGYLYLTDRKSFMIISGGVNIYPQEIENLLITHPKVADVAVVGGPHEEMGEEVIAVIQPAEWSEAGDDLAAELNAFARANLSHVKTPRKIDFMQELPRHQTGKLYKRLIRDAYWGKADSKIVG
jgi:acyl-CoA synthetase (AMP-forming)/AMP-acid ligase II